LLAGEANPFEAGSEVLFWPQVVLPGEVVLAGFEVLEV
jgi:hypothetical protein